MVQASSLNKTHSLVIHKTMLVRVLVAIPSWLLVAWVVHLEADSRKIKLVHLEIKVVSLVSDLEASRIISLTQVSAVLLTLEVVSLEVKTRTSLEVALFLVKTLDLCLEQVCPTKIIILEIKIPAQEFLEGLEQAVEVSLAIITKISLVVLNSRRLVTNPKQSSSKLKVSKMLAVCK